MLQKIIGILKEKSWKTFLLHLGFIVIIVVTLILIFFFVYLPSTTRHGETVTVPNLEGMSLLDMDDFLKKRHLNYEVSDSGYSSQYPPLSILKQYPLAGSYVKEKRKIYLTVKAKQPQSVNMPDLKDGSLKNAELVLKSYGLKRGMITYKPDLASNAVLEQLFEGKIIERGDRIRKGSKIDLIVGDGLGRRVFSVPRFIGLPIDEADFSIKGSGLNTGSVIIKIIDEEKMLELVELAKELEIDTATIIESGHVFQQRPEIGKDIRLGQQVDLWVGSLDEEDSLQVLENWMNNIYEELPPDESDEE
ncbi:MAG: PASTA domain-containing protein [Cyclobacteriaceae bacterium]|nr:PASTA domain-containing protein [Cyclobacteriaceae bacterium]MCK5468425.1 PASTA domain-containing protein [Cyclobacteriaceae bacterium]